MEDVLIVEVCGCGRIGDLADREPVMDADFVGALRCPACGHLEHMDRFPLRERLALWNEAKRRRRMRHVRPPRDRRAA
jgi:hypothetical protein